jgi:hypothetical protein
MHKVGKAHVRMRLAIPRCVRLRRHLRLRLHPKSSLLRSGRGATGPAEMSCRVRRVLAVLLVRGAHAHGLGDPDGRARPTTLAQRPLPAAGDCELLIAPRQERPTRAAAGERAAEEGRLPAHAPGVDPQQESLSRNDF